VHALDALRGALAATRADAAIDRTFVVDAIDALMVIGAKPTALDLLDAWSGAPAVPRAYLDALPALRTSMNAWDEALIAMLESRRTFRH
jgi:hypothetical protein